MNSRNSNSDRPDVAHIPTLLVVEDDVGLNRLVCKCLEKAGYKTLRALTGSEAIIAVEKNADILMLLDYKLPDMTAEELANRIAAAGKAVPFVIMTGMGDERTAVAMMKLGAQEYIVKETNFVDSLPHLIARVIDALTTARKLKESEEKFRNYVERAPDGVFTVDNTGRYMEVNTSACRILGYAKEELLHMSIRDLVAEESSKDGIDHFKHVMEAGAATSDIWHIHKDGSKRCLTVNAVKIAETQILGFCKDITDRTRTEETLTKSETKLRAVLDAAPFPVAIVDAQDNNIEFWSHSAHALFGHTAATAPEWYELAYPDPAYRQEVISRWKPLVEKARSSGQTINAGEYRITCRNGSVRICELYASFINESLIVTFNDMTERKQADKLLRESEERHRVLFERSRDALMTLEPPSWKFTSGNPACFVLFNVRKENEFTSFGPGDFSPPLQPDGRQSDEKAKEMIETAMRTGSHFFEWSHKKLHGEAFPATVLLTRLELGGRTLLQATVRDITAQRQASDRELLARDILGLLNSPKPTMDSIRSILLLIKKSTGLEAVGIRLREGDDFPYYVANGFAENFLRTEDRLCAYDKDGNVIRDSAGSPLLECMCGNILCGRANPELPFFTKGGSFWSNCTSDLLASTSGKDLRAQTRNRCNSEGYESVAIIPLRSGTEIIGTLQLNDRRKNQLTIDMIHLFEGLGAAIGIAVARKQTENENRVLAKFPSENPNPVLRIGRDGKLLYVNEAGLTQLPDWHLQAGQNIPTILRGIALQSLSSGSARSFDVQHGERAFSFFVAPVPDAGYANLYGYDITERKRAEENLQFKNLILSTQQEASIDGILVVDEKGKILSHNRRFAEMFAIAANILESKSIEHAMRAVADKIANPEEFFARLQSLLDGSSETIRGELVLKDGRTLDRYSAPMTSAEGKQYGRIWYFRDITERKFAEAEKEKLEGQLRQSQKMEAIGQLAGGIAHDFNNILGGIMGYANLIKLQIVDNPKLRTYCVKIADSVNRGAALARQLLAFARKGNLTVESVDMHSIIHETIDILKRTVDRRIELKEELVAQPSVVRGDANQLSNAILNLSINARDAMPAGGIMTFITSTVALDDNSLINNEPVEKGGAYVRVSVCDTGIGMSEEIKARLFEPFFTTKEMGKGTGLGLASVYGIVKQHNGYIKVESEPGKGSRFHVYLPSADADNKQQRAGELPAVKGRGKVLLVDDEEPIRETITEGLTDLGYDVVCCGDPLEAIKIYRQQHQDIAAVLLDIIMPHMSGLDCLRLLKMINPAVTVVIVSGYSKENESQRMLEEGARGFVEKPFTIETLSRVLAKAIKY